MGSNTNTTIQSSSDSITSRINDRKLEQALAQIYSNKNLGLSIRSFTFSVVLLSATLDVSDAVVVCDTTASAGTLTLPYASSWSTTSISRSPLVFIVNSTSGGTHSITVNAQSGDTITGVTSVGPGVIVQYIVTGTNTWFGFTISTGVFVQKAGDTMTGPLHIDTITSQQSSSTGLSLYGTYYTPPSSPSSSGGRLLLYSSTGSIPSGASLVGGDGASTGTLSISPHTSVPFLTHMVWTGGNFGLNSPNPPTAALHLVGTSGNGLRVDMGSNQNHFVLTESGTDKWIQYLNAGTLRFWDVTAGADRVVIDTSGNVAVSKAINVGGGSSLSTLRSSFSGNSEPYVLAVKYVSTGGACYFGATDGTSTPGFQISNAGGGALISGTTGGVISIPGTLALSGSTWHTVGGALTLYSDTSFGLLLQAPSTANTITLRDVSGNSLLVAAGSDKSLTAFGALIHGGVPEVAQGASSTPIATADTYLSFKQGSVASPSATMTYETPAIYIERHTNNPSSAAYSNHSNLQLSGAITSEVVAYANEWGSPNCFVGRVQSNFPIPTNTVFSISSLTQTGGTATAVTTVAHGYSTGWQVVVSGASPAGYDGTVTITVVNSTTFTYSVSSGLTSPATGTITVQKSPTTPNGLVGITTMALSQATSGTHRDTWGANFTADFNNTGAAKPANCVGIEVDVLPGISSASSADNYSGFWAQTSGRGLGIVANAAFMSTQTAGGGWNYGLLMDGVIKSILISTATNTITSGIDISSYSYSSYHIKTPSFGVQNTGFGYITGGGTVVQGTSKSTAVTQNALCGTIQTTTSALAAGTIVSFQLNNSNITANDLLVLNHHGGGTPGSYTLEANCGAGLAIIFIRNNTAGSLSEALLIRYAIVKGA